MADPDEKKSKDLTFEDVVQNFMQDGVVSDEQFAKNTEASQALEGTSRESATLNKDGVLLMHYWSMKDHAVAEGWHEFKPDDADYADLCARHGLSKPGDSNQIILKWQDGEWR